ncbi:MAG: hypothetical protein ACFFAY_13290 [Promethearchaeota archaeon]
MKDIKASNAFYKKLGFVDLHGCISHNWIIMKNGEYVIGSFQGILEKNTLAVNLWWDRNAQPLESFTDVRDLQR